MFILTMFVWCGIRLPNLFYHSMKTQSKIIFIHLLFFIHFSNSLLIFFVNQRNLIYSIKHNYENNLREPNPKQRYHHHQHDTALYVPSPLREAEGRTAHHLHQLRHELGLLHPLRSEPPFPVPSALPYAQ